MPHNHHKRHAQAFALPKPAAIASAVAEAFPFANPEPQQKTSTVVVYKTLAPTFSGQIAGYSTQGAPAPKNDATTPAPQPTTRPAQPTVVESATPEPTPESTSIKPRPSSAAMPSPITKAVTSLASTTPLLATATTSRSAASRSSASSTATATSLPQTTATEMTGGAKAGIAIGAILAIGAIASLIFFCFRQRRKKAEHQRLDDEKFSSTNDAFGANRAASTRTARTASTAPRLSLRPVTQFLPGFGDNKQANRPNNAYGNGPNAAMAMESQTPKSAWDRPMTSDSHNRSNPFGNHAEAVDPVNAAGPSVVQSAGPEGAVMAGAAAVAGTGAAVGLTRGASKRENNPKPMDFTRTLPGVGPPSPSGTEFSVSEAPGTPTQTSGGAAIAAAGGPSNSTVHRVQLDFKPSMEDELELRAGQLIRLLHEYDDGWALCIRLDRSQQGVVPRTCLSTRPVKPRPQQGPPRGNPPPGMRVPQQHQHQQQQGRPMSPAMNVGQRPASPAGPRQGGPGPQYYPQGRPSSPAGNRSPGGPQHHPQQRPMTPNGRSSPAPGQMQDRRMSPPGASQMNQSQGTRSPYGSPPNGTGPVGRKPVPGQAM